MHDRSRFERRRSAAAQSDTETGCSAARKHRVAVALFVAYVGAWALPLNASAEDVITLHSEGGIQVIGKTKVESRLAAKCLEGPYAQQSLAVWRVDYSVVNKSGRRLASVTAEVPIASPMPRCDKWSPLPKRFNEHKPVLWGDSVHTLHSSGLDKNKEVRGAVFVLVTHDQQPRFGSPTLTYTFPCSEPAPLHCSHSGKLRLDPMLLMISRRRVWDSPPEIEEIDPFKGGTTNFDLRLAGFDLSYEPMKDRLRLGVNGSFAISNYVPSVTQETDAMTGEMTGVMTSEDTAMMTADEPAMMTIEETAVLTVVSFSGFLQFNNLFRIEVGWMHAVAGHAGLADGKDDKSAWFCGVAFPLASDQIRKLVEKLW